MILFILGFSLPENNSGEFTPVILSCFWRYQGQVVRAPDLKCGDHGSSPGLTASLTLPKNGGDFSTCYV